MNGTAGSNNGYPMSVIRVPVNGRYVTEAELAEMIAHRMARLQENIEAQCPGCGNQISPRYLQHGVCQNCYGTTDDPKFGTECDSRWMSP